ncbi:hypothetical protein FVE85_1325 [Porphyridium purpureum]|uniref:NADH dehydrogenase [ubiquinone] 1 beta subcomplex subunit 11, mitochondrial n=1 Tax=Porphyridium purpureum TaxID=35688 RepID=A0A5J4YHY6_PORPP|nr:hypothetical protein FVE85_1325 [Porphyridium purpureum]|eukprot:POR4666..scf251_18
MSQLRRLFGRSTGLRVALRGDKHEEVFNEPGGRLFGEPLRKPGEKRKWDDWELPTYVWIVGTVVMWWGFKLVPREESFQDWALVEAKARLKEREARLVEKKKAREETERQSTYFMGPKEELE